MAHSYVYCENERSTTICAGVEKKIRLQFAILARLHQTSVSGMLGKLICHALATTKLPRSTGIKAEMQNDPRVLNNLSEFVLEGLQPGTVSDERLLWDDDDPAVRFFRLCYLIPELLDPLEQQTWMAIKSNTVIEYNFADENGIRRKAWTDGDQARCEAYIKKHWGEIERACRGSLPTFLLPVERETREELQNFRGGERCQMTMQMNWKY